MRLRIVTRLTLWYAAVLFAIVSSVASFLLVRLHADLVRSLDGKLAIRASQIIAERGRADTGAEHPDLGNLPSVAGLPKGEFVIQEITPGDPGVESSDPSLTTSVLPGEPVAAASRGPVRVAAAVGNESFRFLAVRIDPAAPTILAVGESLESVEQTTRHFMLLLLAAIPFAVGAAALGGSLLSRRALGPIDRMTRDASAISAIDLSARVEQPAVDDEVGRLARTLNSMLERVDEAVGSQRRFVSDAAHELRTPLAIMRSEIDVAEREIAPGSPAAATLRSLGEEVDRLRRLADNLLALARLQEGRLELLRDEARLDEIASDVVGSVSQVSADAGVALGLHPAPAPTVGDRERLRQVLLNVLDNAIRYTPPGGEVEVSTGADERSAWARVTDTGRGMSPEEREQAFARFFRSDDARASVSAGSGLGLAICKGIVEAHAGTISIEAGEDGIGTVVTISLPRSPAAGLVRG